MDCLHVYNFVREFHTLATRSEQWEMFIQWEELTEIQKDAVRTIMKLSWKPIQLPQSIVEYWEFTLQVIDRANWRFIMVIEELFLPPNEE